MSNLLYANHKGLHKDFKAINTLAKKATKDDYVITFKNDSIRLFVLEKDGSFFAEIHLVPSKFKTILTLGINGTYTINATILTDILTNISTTSLLFAHDFNGLYFNNSVIDMERHFDSISVPKLNKAIDIVSIYKGNITLLDNIDMSEIEMLFASKTKSFITYNLSDSLHIILSKAMVPYDLSNAKGRVLSNGTEVGLLVLDIISDNYTATQYIRFIPF